MSQMSDKLEKFTLTVEAVAFWTLLATEILQVYTFTGISLHSIKSIIIKFIVSLCAVIVWEGGKVCVCGAFPERHWLLGKGSEISNIYLCVKRFPNAIGGKGNDIYIFVRVCNNICVYVCVTICVHVCNNICVHDNIYLKQICSAPIMRFSRVFLWTLACLCLRVLLVLATDASLT